MHSTAPQTPLPTPVLLAGTQQSLGIHSTLSELPLYQFSVAADCAIQALIEHFTKSPDLPGIIITELGQTSVLARQQFLECLLHLGHTACFKSGSVRLVLHQANRRALTLTGHTPILLGAQQALKRPLEQQNEPILVQCPDGPHLLDARTLNVAHWQIRGIETQIRYERLQMQLLQSEKMAALGRLVDGVAHEILDPVSFIWGNLSYIAGYAQQQRELLMAYEAALPAPPPEVAQLRDEVEIEYLREDLPAAIASARSGAFRLRQLATSLQNFCHIDEVHPRPTDLNTLLDSILRLLKSRLITSISMECCYGKLPPVPCFPGQLSQVFMNLLINAIDSLLSQTHLQDLQTATAPELAAAKAPQITITTCVLSDQETQAANPNDARWVSVIITDNGPGLPPETKAQVTRSFSTQSRSRKETGLALSYQIITAKHGGRFWMRSFHASEEICSLGDRSPTGTEFQILLPLTSGEP